jgi:hypothetical protein
VTLAALLLGVLLCLIAWQAFAAHGKDHGPFDPALVLTYLWVIALSMVGGVVQFYRKVRVGHARAFNVAELVGELCVSGLAGVITFFLCKWAAMNDWGTAAFVGIAGHMGSRALFMSEQVMESTFRRLFGRGSPAPAEDPQAVGPGTPGDQR